MHDISQYPIIKNTSNIPSISIINILKQIFDPEIHYSIYDLGLIYEIIIDNNKIHILMTLTSANCPEAQSIPDNVFQELSTAFPNFLISVDITFEPTWTVDNMADEVKLGLGLL
jgi:metal-sulfur cluster biosynthetic enzyme